MLRADPAANAHTLLILSCKLHLSIVRLISVALENRSVRFGYEFTTFFFFFLILQPSWVLLRISFRLNYWFVSIKSSSVDTIFRQFAFPEVRCGTNEIISQKIISFIYLYIYPYRRQMHSSNYTIVKLFTFSRIYANVSYLRCKFSMKWNVCNFT